MASKKDQEIEKLLSSLESAPLLKYVGEPIKDRKIIRISSWEDLEDEEFRINYLASHEVLSGVITDLYSEEDDDEFSEMWREKMVLHIRPRVRAFTKPLGELIPLSKPAVKEIVRQIGDDMISACKEIECGKQTESTYFRETMEWFLRGHLPCGREGEACDGDRIVF